MGKLDSDENSGLSLIGAMDENETEKKDINMNIIQNDVSLESSGDSTHSGNVLSSMKHDGKESALLEHETVFHNEISSESNASEANKIDSGNDQSESSKSENDSSSDSESSSSEEELTDVSDKEEEGSSGNGQQLMSVPEINVLSATDVSASDSSLSNSEVEKSKTTEEPSRESDEWAEKSLSSQLQEWVEAKERVETNLRELQLKYQQKLKDEEELIQQLHRKDELNVILEAKELELMQEVISLKRQISENLDNALDKSDPHDIPSQLQSLNDELKSQLRELQLKLASSEALLAGKSSHVESLEREVLLLKEKITSHQEDEKEVSGSKTLEALSSHEVKAKVESMVAEVIDDSQKRIQMKDLEEEVDQLKGKLRTSEAKYATDMAEALATLKQVQDAYGEMRDIVLEEYKNEVAVLTDRVRIAEENSNEAIITGLRQELLDSRLQHERTKQSYDDEREIQRKTISDHETKQKELLTQVEQSKLDLEAKTEHSKNIQSSLQRNQVIADERKEKINHLNTQIKKLNSSIESTKKCVLDKNDEIVQLKGQLVRAGEDQEKNHAEKEALQMELDVMESVKRQNKRLENEVEETNHKVKLRGAKIKFLKKHIKELETQKSKAENAMLVIPEMQQKIDQLSEEKLKLQQDIIDRQRQEEEEKRKKAEEKKQEQLRIQKEKEDWERRTLGIGKCLESHEEENVTCGDPIPRPSSAPLLKPRPPTSRRRSSKKNNSMSTATSAPTLNPSYLLSYPQGRKATQKMKQHQEKVLLSQSLSSPCGRFSSVTKPFSYANASYKHVAGGKNFPNISPKSKNENSIAPRVLVWGDGDGGAGNKMLAVGDHVLTNIHSECSSHGHLSKQHSGVVKFIGFVEGNEEDVYVGVRLEEDIGYTDGTIQGKRYFRCEPEKGTFVHLNNIVKVNANYAPTFAK